jgi:bifunctional non-homologous end joining protein LigD
LTKTHVGIRISEHIEADGESVFRHARRLGCEGIVSKQRASTYRSGRVRTWIKTKNPDSPAMKRVW